MTLNFAMGEKSVDELAARARREGASQVTGPVDQPWNARELTVHDPDRYRLRFTQPIDPQRSLDEVVDQVNRDVG